MQEHARFLVDISDEALSVHRLYGLDNRGAQEPGRRMLFAARLSERYVRFVQAYAGSGAAWDGHNDIKANHERLAASS